MALLIIESARNIYGVDISLVNLIKVYIQCVLLVKSMSYVTVSAKIPRRLKELMDKYGIKPGPVIRRAIEEEVKKRVLAELEEKRKDILGEIASIPDEEVVNLIRGDRERR